MINLTAIRVAVEGMSAELSSLSGIVGLPNGVNERLESLKITGDSVAEVLNDYAKTVPGTAVSRTKAKGLLGEPPF